MDTFIRHLEEALSRPLPGREAQFRMAHVSRRFYKDAPSHARRAGVLALLYPKAGAWHIALIERTASNPNDRHGGQISFPGGSYDPSDGALIHTALRETEEEIGVPRSNIQVIGALTELYIPVSNFEVFPFVGYADHRPDFAPQAEEVQTIIETPFSVFQDPASVQITEIRFGPQLVLRDVPCYMVQGRVVWGATAMVLSELVEVVGGE